MWPALLLLRIQRIWLPIPLFLLWPLMGFVWLVIVLVNAVLRSPESRFARYSLCVLCELRGLKVNVEDRKNTQISVLVY